ncbi:hypothetical protein MMC17_005973 [Xylographa soralifera]|nr:hypothetical protein [Xylographa soralifera]
MAAYTDPRLIPLSRQAYASGYIRLPWANRPFTLGEGFSTTLADKTRNSPFLQLSAFDTDALAQAKLSYQRFAGCAGAFKSRESTSSSRSSEHLSVGFGATIGNDYLNVSVTGGYDKALLNNKDSCKTSIQASYRAGAIRFSGEIPLSKAATSILQGADGFQHFSDIYGDYYVGGLHIGADTGVLVSQDREQSESSEQLSVTLKVQILCFSDSKTWNKADVSAYLNTRFSVNCFDTLENIHYANDLSNIVEAHDYGQDFAARAHGLSERCEKLLTGWTHELMQVSRETCEGIGQSNLVAEVLLLPFAKLREVAAFVS